MITMMMMLINLMVAKMATVKIVSRMLTTTFAVLDTAAFERLLGPCMETMKEKQVADALKEKQVAEAFRS